MDLIPKPDQVVAAAGNVAHTLLYGGLADLRPMPRTLIDDGELREVVKNPNYRGISATFWRSLAGVGDESTFEVMGTPFCGKGEPSQVIRVGHASPACRFTDVDVFGGEG